MYVHVHSLRYTYCVQSLYSAEELFDMYVHVHSLRYTYCVQSLYRELIPVDTLTLNLC